MWEPQPLATLRASPACTGKTLHTHQAILTLTALDDRSQCIFCDAGNELLNIIYMNIMLQNTDKYFFSQLSNAIA
jgi:hypothetical protein